MALKQIRYSKCKERNITTWTSSKQFLPAKCETFKPLETEKYIKIIQLALKCNRTRTIYEESTHCEDSVKLNVSETCGTRINVYTY